MCSFQNTGWWAQSRKQCNIPLNSVLLTLQDIMFNVSKQKCTSLLIGHACAQDKITCMWYEGVIGRNFWYKKVTIFIVPVLRMTDTSVHSCMGTETYETLPSSGMWHGSLANMYQLSRGAYYLLHQMEETCRLHNTTSQKTVIPRVTAVSSLYHKGISVSMCEPGCNKNGAWYHSLCVNNLTLLPNVTFCCRRS